MGKLSTAGNRRVRARLADLPDAVILYRDLLVSQNATSYWPFQTAKTVGQTESDSIGSITMTMTSGDVPALSAGDGPLGGAVASTDKGITFAAADTELMLASVTFDTRQNWSLSGWWRVPSTLSGTGPVFFTLDGTDGTHSIFLIHRDDRGGLVCQLAAGGSAAYVDPGSIQVGDNAWHHIALTRSYSSTDTADVWTLYYDGSQVVQVNSNTLGLTPTAFSSAVTAWSLNALPSNVLNLSGDSAHVAVRVGGVWSAAQITAQWNMRL